MVNAIKKVYIHPSSTFSDGPILGEIFLCCCCLQNKKLRLCSHSLCLIFQHCIFVPYIKAQKKQTAQEPLRFVCHRQGAKHQLRHHRHRRVSHRIFLILFTSFSLLDMFKSFFLFWTANVISIWLLISLLHLYIPLNMILRSCCIENVQHHKTHWLSTLIILAGCIINMFTLRKVDVA